MAAVWRALRYTLPIVILLAAFMTADRLWLHLYVPEEQRTTDLREEYDSFQQDLVRYLRDLQTDVDDVGTRADDASSASDTLRDCVNDLGVYIYDFPYGEIDGSC